MTIADVCRRAGVTAPSIYARVDGKAGLFRAVHERWLEDVDNSETDAVSEVSGVGDPDPAIAAAAAAEVMARIFDRHEAILRAVSDRAPHDAALHARGSEASRAMIERLSSTVPLSPPDATAIMRTVYAECVLRLRYGPSFLAEPAESDDAFRDRVQRVARLLAAGSADGGLRQPRAGRSVAGELARGGRRGLVSEAQVQPERAICGPLGLEQVSWEPGVDAHEGKPVSDEHHPHRKRG